MTRKELELREKANIERYVNHNRDACTDSIMELYYRIPDVGGIFKSLYRYRPLNSYELESLKNGTIFMRWPSSYEDGEDCTPVFDFGEISKYIIEKKYPGFDSSELYERFVNIEDIKNNPKFAQKVNDMRNMWLIACFTERYDNQKMWMKYAQNENGICLVYNMKDILDTVKQNNMMSIMPVRYVENRSDCTDIMLNHIDLIDNRDETESKYFLTCTTKDKLKFSFEEEWRLIYEKENTDANMIGESVPFINPDIILCGSAIDKKSREYKELLKIADDRGMKVI